MPPIEATKLAQIVIQRFAIASGVTLAVSLAGRFQKDEGILGKSRGVEFGYLERAQRETVCFKSVGKVETPA